MTYRRVTTSLKGDMDVGRTESKPAGARVNVGLSLVNFLAFPTTTQASNMAFHGEYTRLLL